MPYIQFNFRQRPAWQRYLMVASSIVITALLLWLGFIIFISLAVLAIAVALINRVKLAVTGRPLFKTPQHFHRYQSQFNKDHNVIEGEVIDRGDDKPPK